MSHKMIKEVMMLSEIKNFKYKHRVYSKGDYADAFYIIKSGKFVIGLNERISDQPESPLIKKQRYLRKQNTFSNMKFIKISVKGQGEFFGESEILTNSNRKFSVECDSLDSEVYVLKKQDFISKIYSDNHFYTKIQEHSVFTDEIHDKFTHKSVDTLSSSSKFLVFNPHHPSDTRKSKLNNEKQKKFQDFLKPEPPNSGKNDVAMSLRKKKKRLSDIIKSRGNSLLEIPATKSSSNFDRINESANSHNSKPKVSRKIKISSNYLSNLKVNEKINPSIKLSALEKREISSMSINSSRIIQDLSHMNYNSQREIPKLNIFGPGRNSVKILGKIAEGNNPKKKRINTEMTPEMIQFKEKNILSTADKLALKLKGFQFYRIAYKIIHSEEMNEQKSIRKQFFKDSYRKAFVKDSKHRRKSNSMGNLNLLPH